MNRVILLLLLLISKHNVQSLYGLYTILNDAHDTHSRVSTPSSAELMDQIMDIKSDINRFTQDVTRKVDELATQLLTQLPRIGKVNRRMESFMTHFVRINYLYRKFERMISTRDAHRSRLEDFRTNALGIGSDSVDATLDAIHKLFLPYETGYFDEGLLELLAQDLQTVINDTCNVSVPPAEQLFSLYTALSTVEVRGFMMTSLTYLLLEQVSNVNYEREVSDARTDALIRVRGYMEAIGDVVTWTSRKFYLCDPPDGYNRRISFFEFFNFESLYVVNQRSIRPEDHCSNYCPEIIRIWSVDGDYECAEEDSACALMHPCRGQIRNCQTIDMNPIDMCAQDGFMKRHYTYLLTDSENYGSVHTCSSLTRAHRFKEYSPEAGKYYNCDTCMCTCIQDDSSSLNVHAFSLRSQIADVADDKVLTGIKFTARGYMTYLQIQQGRTLGGDIVRHSLDWKPFDIMHFESDPNNNSTPIFVDDSGQVCENEKDYTFLADREREFYLDDLFAPDGYVVTGARLQRDADSGRAIQLELHVTPYNFSTGELMKDTEKSYWISSYMMKSRFPEYDKEERDIIEPIEAEEWEPVTFTERTEIVSKPFSVISVTTTSMTKDLRYIVYPLLDIREVAASPPFLVEGIGLFYKRTVGEGEIGYLAFRLYAINRKKFLDADAVLPV